MRQLVPCVLLFVAVAGRPAAADSIILSNLTAIDFAAGGPDIASVTSAFRFVAPTTAWLTGVTIWSTENPTQNQWNGTAEWAIFGDGGNGRPAAAPSDSGVGLDVSRRLLFEGGQFGSLNREYTFTLDNPTHLTAGTAYWFAPRFPGQQIAWAGVTPGLPGLVTQRQLGATEWLVVQPGSLGFELRGQESAPVPEPASLLLVASGIGGLALRKRWGRRPPTRRR